MARKEPTKKQLITDAADIWQRGFKQRAIDNEIDDLLWNRHEVEVPEGLDKVERKSGKAYETITRLDGLLMSQEPIANVEVGTMGRGDTKRGNNIEDFLEGFAEQAKATQDPWGRQGLDVLTYGRGVAGIYGAPQFWADYPERGTNESATDYNRHVEEFLMGTDKVPIAWRHIPAREFVPIWGDNHRLRAGWWFTMKNAQDVFERYKLPRLKAQYKELKPSDYVYWIEGANDQWMWQGAAAGADWRLLRDSDQLPNLDAIEVINVFEHMTPGYVPYVFIGGMESGSAIPELEFYSVLYPMKKLIQDYDSSRSQFATAFRSLGLFTMLVHKASAENRGIKGDTREPPVIQFEPLKELTIWSDEDLSWLEHPALSQDFERDWLRMERDMDRLGFAALENMSADASGYARAVTIATAKKRFDRIVAKMARGYQEICERVLAVVKNIPNGEKVYVYKYGAESKGFVSLSARDLSRPYRIHVDIPSPISPDLAAATQVAMQLRQTDGRTPPLYDDARILEVIYHEQHPERIIDRVLIQEDLRTPELRQRLVRDAMRDADLLLSADEAAETMQDIALQQQYQIPGALAAALGGGAAELLGAAGNLAGPELGQTAVPGAGAPVAEQTVGPGRPLVPGPLVGQMQATPSGPQAMPPL